MLKTHQKQGVIKLRAVRAFRCQEQPLTKWGKGASEGSEPSLAMGAIFAPFEFMGHIVPRRPRD